MQKTGFYLTRSFEYFKFFIIIINNINFGTKIVNKFCNVWAETRMARVNKRDVRRIADLIESYLNNHPNAADTAEGIAKWWLPLEDEVSNLVIEQALNYLSSKSIVTRNNNSIGHTIYSGKKTNIKTQSN